MAPKTKELVSICEQLPPQKIDELVDFARFLRQQAGGQTEGDREWERIIADAQLKPKLDAFVKQALSEGEAGPLNPEAM